MVPGGAFKAWKTDKLAAGPGEFSFKAWRKERKNVHGS